jgi:hypothetical protein
MLSKGSNILLLGGKKDMQKVIGLFIVILFIGTICVPAMGEKNELNKETMMKEMIITFSKPQINLFNDKITISVSEANTILKQPNKPILPMYKKTFIYPDETQIESVDISLVNAIQKEHIEGQILCASSELLPTDREINKFFSDKVKSILPMMYPDSWYDYSISHGMYQGKQSLILNIALFPVRVLNNHILYVNDFQIEITVKEKKDSQTLSIDEKHLLIIAPQEFIEPLKEFATHKESKGITTTLVNLESIYDSTFFPVEGRDNAEKVKYFIKNAYDEWDIQYILLVGGRKPGIAQSWYVPVRYVHVFWAEETHYISDLYYADIYNADETFSTWDTDENNIFCQWSNNGILQDEIDMYPEVYVGRWPCRNKFELDIIIEKTITYENMQSQKKIVLVGGDTFENEGLEGELVCDKSLEYLPNFSSEKVYGSEMKFTPKNIRDALGDGAMFMHMHGHGSPIKWGTHYPESFDERMDGIGIKDVPWFSNDEYPILILGGCHTALFNISLFHQPWIYGLKITPEGLAWCFARKIDGGSIATLGYTCFPTGAPGEYGDLNGDGINEPDCVESGYGYMQLQLLKGYGIKQYQYLGECWGYAVSTYNDAFKIPFERWHLHTSQGFVLLGDPSLRIGGYE